MTFIWNSAVIPRCKYPVFSVLHRNPYPFHLQLCAITETQRNLYHFGFCLPFVALVFILLDPSLKAFLRILKMYVWQFLLPVVVQF